MHFASHIHNRSVGAGLAMRAIGIVSDSGSLGVDLRGAMSHSSGDRLEGAVPLSEAIKSLREELALAEIDGTQRHLRFKAGAVELTLQVAATSAGKASGGVKWWLIDAQGELSRQSVATQTVKITLEPVTLDAAGNPSPVYLDVEVGDNDPSSDSHVDEPA
jgi:hypothetical protein